MEKKFDGRTFLGRVLAARIGVTVTVRLKRPITPSIIVAAFLVFAVWLGWDIKVAVPTLDPGPAPTRYTDPKPNGRIHCTRVPSTGVFDLEIDSATLGAGKSTTEKFIVGSRYRACLELRPA